MDMQAVETKNKPQINADERRFIESGVQRIFVDDIDSNLINSPQRTQSSQRFFKDKFARIRVIRAIRVLLHSILYYSCICVYLRSSAVNILMTNQKSELNDRHIILQGT